MQINDSGKTVTVKQERICHSCKSIIPKGSKAFSISIKVVENRKPKRIRIWTHLGDCSTPYAPRHSFWNEMGYPSKPHNHQNLF